MTNVCRFVKSSVRVQQLSAHTQGEGACTRSLVLEVHLDFLSTYELCPGYCVDFLVSFVVSLPVAPSQLPICCPRFQLARQKGHLPCIVPPVNLCTPHDACCRRRGCLVGSSSLYRHYSSSCPPKSSTPVLKQACWPTASLRLAATLWPRRWAEKPSRPAHCRASQEHARAAFSPHRT